MQNNRLFALIESALVLYFDLIVTFSQRWKFVDFYIIGEYL